jgi:lysophospholipase L1-like esterase
VKLRALLTNLLVGLTSLLATLAVVELGVRCFVSSNEQKPTTVYDVDHANRDLSFLPGRSRHYQTPEFSFDAHFNAFGRRDVEWPPSVVSDPHSVLFIGDSFAFGIGVDHEQTIPSQLEARFRAAGHPVEVMNFGMPGSGAPPGYAILLDDALAKGFAARNVVVAIFVGNDFYPSVLTDFEPKPATPAPEPAAASGGGSWLAHWRTLQVLKLRVSQSARLVGWALAIGQRLGVSLYDSAGTYVFLREQTPQQEALFHQILGHIGHMNESCRANGRRLFAVIIPNRIQVENRDTLSGAIYDAARPHRDILRYCDEIGIACLDLLPVLSAAYERDHEPLYYAADRHFNQRGYKLASDAIADFLSARGVP